MARLVVKGLTEIEGINYKEKFSSMVRFTSTRLLLALVGHLDLELIQMDINIAFLSNLEEHIYMDQPISFVSKKQEDKVSPLVTPPDFQFFIYYCFNLNGSRNS